MNEKQYLDSLDERDRKILENTVNWPFGKDVKNHLELNLQVREAIVWLWNLGREER